MLEVDLHARMRLGEAPSSWGNRYVPGIPDAATESVPDLRLGACRERTPRVRQERLGA